MMCLNKSVKFSHRQPVVFFAVYHAVAVGAEEGKVGRCDSAGLGQGVEGEGVVDFDEAFAVVAVSFGEIEGAGFASAFNRSPMLSLLSFSS